MKLTKTTIAATLAVLSISSLAITPASAAVRDSYRSAVSFYNWSDITSLTHGAASKDVNTLIFGRTADNPYKWSDKASVTHRGVPAGSKQIGRFDANHYKWSDINSLTHR